MFSADNMVMAAAFMPLFIAAYYFGKMNGKEQTLEAVLAIATKEGWIQDEDIPSESDQH